MRISLGLVSAAAIMVAGTAAHAERVGPYISVYGGYVIQQDADLTNTIRDEVSFDNGFAVGGSFGYDFGSIRLEGEAAFRRNEADELSDPSVGARGHFSSLALMLNAIYDFSFSSRFTPYIGAGVGGAMIYAKHLRASNGAPIIDSDDELVFAYQGIAGVRFAVTEGLSLFVDYRYFATLDPEFKRWDGNARVDSEYKTHNIMAGLTYTFGAVDAIAPAPVVTPAPAEPVAIARSYIVFFDWNSTAITPEAQAIIQDAASAASSLGVSRIELTGHADRSGSAAYNQRLSVRRAEAVKKVLVGLGVPASAITTVGKGESAPLVPTPDGVREPQNRRVEIVLP